MKEIFVRITTDEDPKEIINRLCSVIDGETILEEIRIPDPQGYFLEK